MDGRKTTNEWPRMRNKLRNVCNLAINSPHKLNLRCLPHTPFREYKKQC